MRGLETQVSKTDPTIKKIIEATSLSSGNKWTGRLVSVIQIDPSWTRQIYNDTLEAHVYIVGSLGSKTTVFRVPPPRYGEPATQVNAPDRGEVVVVRQVGTAGPITIYVPTLDAATLDVARDAMLSKDAKRAREVLQQLGPYAGIGAAVIRAQGKTLESAARGEGTTAARKRKLDRDIADFMRSRQRG